MAVRLVFGLLVAVIIAVDGLPLDTSEGIAESHEHWEHIVRRRSISSLFENQDIDETSHIVDLQEYYRESLDQGWDEHDKELMHLLQLLEKVTAQGSVSDEDRASIQDQSHMLEVKVDSKPIRGRFIVMLQSDADDYTLDRTIQVLNKANKESNQRIRASEIEPLRHLKAFVATLNSKTLALLQRHPLVSHIEEDMAVRRSQVDIGGSLSDSKMAESESKPTWNLDRLDQQSVHLDGKYNPPGNGKNVDIYIIDTGVMATHQELEGRVFSSGYDAVDDLTGTHNNGRDCNGHGTHCAGTAAGKTLGVAKEANIYNLRALNCKGTGAVSGIVKGVDKIIAEHKATPTGRPKVISQSLGVKTSVSLNRAIVEATNAGIVMVGAAGNQAGNSCEHSPASAKVGIAVGATNRHDEVTMFTNTGPCTDIMAPGVDIKSASIQCDTCTKTMSGTSMAGPHAAGAAAVILGLKPQLSAVEVKKEMMEQSTKNHVKMSAEIASRNNGDTPDRLLFVGKMTEEQNLVAKAQWAPK